MKYDAIPLGEEPRCKDCRWPLTPYEVEMEHDRCAECRNADGPMHGTGYGDNVNGGLNR